MSLAGAKDEIAPLTGLRGFAALWVLVFHAWIAFGAPRVGWGWLDLTPMLQCGYFGVDLFFVLSGFLLSLPRWRQATGSGERMRWSRFWRRRAARVLPAYWGQIVILVTLALLSGQAPAPLLDPLRLLTHATLTTNLAPGVDLYNGVYWSLPIEWNFYFALPALLYVAAATRGPVVLGIAIGASVAFRAFALEWAGFDQQSTAVLVATQLPGRLDQFMIGILAARLHVRGASPLTSQLVFAASLLLLAVAVLVAAPYGFAIAESRPWFLVHYTMTGAAFGLLVLGCASAAGPARWLFGNAPLRGVGVISYSLYLWHGPLLLALPASAVLAHAGHSAAVWSAIAASFLAAFVSYRLLERPFLHAQAPRPRGGGIRGAEPSSSRPCPPIPAAASAAGAGAGAGEPNTSAGPAPPR